MTPDLLDIVKLKETLSEHGLSKGRTGTIVERYADDAYEVEFSDEYGETIALCVLSPEQFDVVWDATTRSWVTDGTPEVIQFVPSAPPQYRDGWL